MRAKNNILLKQSKKVFLIIIALSITFVFLFPILWVLTSSFKLPGDILSMPPKLSFTPTLANYKAILFGIPVTEGTSLRAIEDFTGHLLNSFIIGGISTVLSLLIGTPMAYVLARFSFRGKNFLSFYILSTRMAPPLALLIPFYLVFNKLGLTDTHFGLIIAYLSFNLSIAIWMMKTFIQDIPIELEEAGMVDGCTRLTAIFKIIFPLMAPGLVATTTFLLLLSWNEFIFALILTGNVTKTAPVAAYGFVTFREVLWGPLFAAGTLIIAPVLLFFLFANKYLLQGLTFGATKG